MKHLFSVFMLGAALLFSLIYYIVAEKTGAASSQAELVFTEVSEAKYIIIHTISTDSIVFKPAPTNDAAVYHCLIDGNFFDKMTGYGMELKDFLSLAGAEANKVKTVVHKTNGFSVFNYVTTMSKKLTKGETYYLIVGAKDSEAKFTNIKTECIKIQL